jgi:hypothetical protein
MKPFEDLLSSYVSSGIDPSVVHRWYERNAPSEKSLSTLAEVIGEAFVSSRIDFNTASGLLNQLMPLLGFEAAPRRFWEYYIAFENFETNPEPDTSARAAIAVLAHGNAS